MILDCAGKRLDLSRPRVMGILNVTPDSFSDGGRFVALDDALRQAEGMVDAGVDIIDVGGESTRPGALATTVDEELVRVVPVIERLHERFDTPLSIDTSKPEVMRAAVSAGAGMINDVCALGVPGATAAAAALAVPVCLMHMQGEPRTMQTAPQYDDVVADIIQYLTGRVDACIAAGIDRARLLVDPGFCFGKSLQHNLVLLRDLQALQQLGLPVLVGLSRKSMLGTLTGRGIDDRLAASVAAAVVAAERGARIIRVHDVAATVDALKLWQAVVSCEL
ncbi:MAG: dihydropteroate synthase [Chromatiaceae bacterium]|nr:dihydropteroate synthase [Gammaproteobacteria bacterium]MCP5316538.1 dihydropteroate synthase [Chromatiaceae bacterium]MCW5585828.1 dihydropteroate synthase [Chromatiales bacterium]MCP5429494.1 dihydropteroate synthase [Chromatiaceae bacterium]MCP5434155.1 dihydropteroate synthase [Chromatiaceae bacterium]